MVFSEFSLFSDQFSLSAFRQLRVIFGNIECDFQIVSLSVIYCLILSNKRLGSEKSLSRNKSSSESQKEFVIDNQLFLKFSDYQLRFVQWLRNRKLTISAMLPRKRFEFVFFCHYSLIGTIERGNYFWLLIMNARQTCFFSHNKLIALQLPIRKWNDREKIWQIWPGLSLPVPFS